MKEDPAELLFGLYALICIGYTTWRIIRALLFHPTLINFCVARLIRYGICPVCRGKDKGCQVCHGYDADMHGYPVQNEQDMWMRRFHYYRERKDSLDDTDFSK
jgi:hypothetical protein